MLACFICMNIVFALIYFHIDNLKSATEFFDYLYFSFITALTIGYGDIYPQSYSTKMIAVAHGIISTLWLALSISLLSLKILTPDRTIIFSKKIIYNKKDNIWIFRVINTHRLPLINPEIRFFICEHCHGNVIAKTYSHYKKDSIPAFGKHDFSIGYTNYIHGHPLGISIAQQYEKAITFEKETGTNSRFRITISVSGSYEEGSASYIMKYYAKDVVFANKFKPIEYGDHDETESVNMKYTKFKNFWDTFNSYV